MSTYCILIAVVFRLAGVLPHDLPDLVSAEVPDSTSSREHLIEERLLEAAGHRGYFDAKMETLLVNGEPVFQLVPGPRYSVGSIAVDGIDGDERGWVIARFREIENTPWESNMLSNMIDDVLRRYETLGFPFASVSIRHVVVDSAQSLIRLRISIREGSLTRLAGLIVGDTVRTRPRTLSRMTGLLPGMVYDHSKILAARNRLLRSGYFSRVSAPILHAGPSADEVIVAFDLEEKSLNAVSGVLGLSREGRVSGQLGLTLRNIAGSAREASLSWEGTDEGYSDFNIFYREPWILGLPPAVEVTIGQTVEDTLWVRRQGTVSVEWELGSGVFGTLGYSTRRIIPGENTESIEGTRSEEGWGEFVWDRENGELLFKTGYALSLRAGYESRRILASGKTDPVVRLGIRTHRGISISRDFLFDMQLSWDNIISSLDELTQPELYSLGGTSTVRGYRDRQFRSNAVGWLRVGWNYIIDSSSGAFVFLDSGYYSQDGSHWILGYGIGLKAVLPIGVFETAYAIPRGSPVLDGRIHMIVSQRY